MSSIRYLQLNVRYYTELLKKTSEEKDNSPTDAMGF